MLEKIYIYFFLNQPLAGSQVWSHVSLINVLESGDIYDRPFLWLIHSGSISRALVSEVYLT